MYVNPKFLHHVSGSWPKWLRIFDVNAIKIICLYSEWPKQNFRYHVYDGDLFLKCGDGLPIFRLSSKTKGASRVFDRVWGMLQHSQVN